jgi:hypothetical protein
MWSNEVKTRIVLSIIVALDFFILFGSALGAGQETGQKLDAATANEVLPYGYMSQDVYNDAASINIPGWTRVAEWNTIFTKGGLETKDAASAGFYASVYRNSKTGEITIAYRGTTDTRDWIANTQASTGIVPAQYEYAAALATLVKTQYSAAPSITVTGHSKGGGEATYAAQQTAGITKVIAFNPASPGILSSATRQGTEQINVIVPGDTVGNPKPGIIGLGHLPGKLYKVESTTAYQPNPFAQTQGPPAIRNKPYYDTVTGTHDMNGVIGGICLVSPSSCLSLQTKGTGQQSQPGTTGAKPVVPSSAVAGGPFSKAPKTIGEPPPAIVATPPWQYGHSPPPSQSPTTNGAAPPSPPIPAAPFSWKVPSTAITPSGTLSAIPPSSHPAGGISLSKAAAARMPLNIALDGAYYHDGQLVVSGRENSTQILDAALLLTALRAACETGDPYFSLDPDNGSAWLDEGRKAFGRLWERVKLDVGWGKPVKADLRTGHSLVVRNIWARRDYAQLWRSITSDYPDLQSRLVFRPLWLQQTRLGEILYKADVLLKELASGASVLETGPLRAAKVDGYVSQLGRVIANNLFAAAHGDKIEEKWTSSRFWFDIAPRTHATGGAFDTQVIQSGVNRELFATLKEHGLVAGGRPYSPPVLQLVKDGDALDLTSVFPTMFVRRHDFVRAVDLPDDDPIMNSFASDVNDSIEKYVSRYKELQALTEVVRAYVVAVHVTNNNESICQRLSGFELLDSEKTDRPLPTFQPSELNIFVAQYVAGIGRGVRTLFGSATSVQGGVAIAGKSFYSAGPIAAVATALTRALKAEMVKQPQTTAWKGAEGRQYIAFALDNDELIGAEKVIPVSLPAAVPDVPGAEISPDTEIENEPVAATLPPH